MDYIVPMPMTVARFQEYIDAYDIDLTHSCAVIDSQEPDLIFGIGMLGVRNDRAWITRLGVLPYARRLGTGQAIMEYLIAEATGLGVSALWLEVIKGNAPAYRLFNRFGFVETRELIVSRRPPSQELPPVDCIKINSVFTLNAAEMISLLEQREGKANWLNETETFRNISRLNGFMFHLDGDSAGWVIYEPSVLQLKRVLVDVTRGDKVRVTQSILHWVHTKLPILDAVSENIAVDDPRWLGYQGAGYFESFKRIEMVKAMTI